ncbi:MAG: DUF3455 domain-containing protein [Terracidiphilus sp.]|jgi:hypothetical protein
MRIPAAFLIAIAASLTALQAQQTPPQPPASIDLPAGPQVVLEAQGNGVQKYLCTEIHDGTNSGLKWVLTGPDAKLLDASGKNIGSHFAGPTWKLNDGSQVQGDLIGSKPSPQANAVPWLLLRAKAGTATGSLANVAYIRRTETIGGVPLTSVCESGKNLQVGYTAKYTFYSVK